MKVFVYGTLKKGWGNNRLLQQDGAVFLYEHVFEGPFDMVDLHAFPGLIESPENQNSKIKGEVYLINDAVLSDLDRLEGNGSFYERRYIEQEDFWVYVLMKTDKYLHYPMVEKNKREEYDWQR